MCKIANISRFLIVSRRISGKVSLVSGMISGWGSEISCSGSGTIVAANGGTGVTFCLFVGPLVRRTLELVAIVETHDG